MYKSNHKGGYIMLNNNLQIKLPDIDKMLKFGSHSCHIYNHIDELVEISIYTSQECKKNNILCVWILPDSLTDDQLNKYLLNNSHINIDRSALQIITSSNWYTSKNSVSDSIRDNFKMMFKYMEINNFTGILILSPITYQFNKTISSHIGTIDLLYELAIKKPVLLLCQFDIQKCSAFDLIDISCVHDYVLTKRNGKWELAENTIHRHMKQELEDSKNFYLTLFDEFPALIWRAGLDTLCDYFNKNWLKFTGRSIDEEFGNGWAEGVHADDIERCVNFYLENFHARKPFSMEYRLKRYDGEYRWILDMGMPFYDLNGQFAGFIGSCYDITERINMENQLQISVKEAQKANNDKSFFLSRMSHEIRTPMNGIAGMLQLLSFTELEKEQQEYVELAKNSSKMLLRIINDILDLSKIESGHFEFENMPFNLRKTASEIIYTFRNNNKKEYVSINLHISPDIPDILVGDKVRISQIIYNLIGNAIKCTEKGEVNLSFSIIYESEFNITLCGIVKDTGIGIPSDQIDKLFKSYSQINNGTDSKKEGTGLGLLITKLLVQNMGGEINVESVEGEWTKFTFTFILNKNQEA